MLLIITSENDYKGEIEIIKEMITYNSVRIHVRKPPFSEEKMRSWLENFTNQELSKMMLHQSHHLVEEFALSGIHFKEIDRKNLSKGIILSLKKKGFLLSSSFHNLKDVQKQNDFDYALLSPIFNSISKKNYSGKEFPIRKTIKPVIALGGITTQNITKTKTLGYSGIAVLGSIWNHKNPLEKFKEIEKEYLKIYKK